MTSEPEVNLATAKRQVFGKFPTPARPGKQFTEIAVFETRRL
jgi:hypothetical protein